MFDFNLHYFLQYLPWALTALKITIQVCLISMILAIKRHVGALEILNEAEVDQENFASNSGGGAPWPAPACAGITSGRSPWSRTGIGC